MRPFSLFDHPLYSLLSMVFPHPPPYLPEKERTALCSMRSRPEMWFKDVLVDGRDKALLTASPLPFVSYSKGSFVRKIVGFS